MMIVLTIVSISCLLSCSTAAGIGKAWDISPGQSSSNEDTIPPSWPRLDLSAFEVRSISGVGHLATREFTIPIKKNSVSQLNREEIINPNESTKHNIAKEVEDMENSFIPKVLYDHHPIFTGIPKNTRKDVEIIPGIWEKNQRRSRIGRNRQHCPEYIEDIDESSDVEEIDERPRVRRDVEETEMEKISNSKNVREPRLNSPESWSKQPLSIEFRHRTNLDENINIENDSSRSSSSSSSSSSSLRGNNQPPQVDFITANRRSSSETRDSRDLPLSRSFDENSYKNNIRDRDLDMSYSRGYYYPENFRTEREYFIRGVNEPATVLSPERYRIEDFDLYRNRPTPKPKRIIYYATLPEIVRKPVDLRTYTRPYDTIGRVPISPINRDGIYKRLPLMLDSRYRYRTYPYGPGYDSYDGYMRNINYQDRSFTPYHTKISENRYSEQDLDHASFKEIARNDATGSSSSNTIGARHIQEKLPWPVHIGTEINVKDNQRVTGRKIFGNQQDYGRFRPSMRIERDDNGNSNSHVDDRN